VICLCVAMALLSGARGALPKVGEPAWDERGAGARSVQRGGGAADDSAALEDRDRDPFDGPRAGGRQRQRELRLVAIRRSAMGSACADPALEA
jgi:hypothetical protein